MSLPSSLPIPTREYPLIRDDEIAARRRFTFTVTTPATKNTVGGADFQINDEL